MAGPDLFLDIVLVTAAAFVGGLVAHVLRLPTIIGFLAAGVVIGPYTPGPTGDVEDIERLAEIGVILLMFGIGVQFSFRQVIESSRLILGGGSIQIALCIVLGIATGLLLGLDVRTGLVLGFLTTATSTVVAVKVLESRSESRSLHAKAALGISVLQDIGTVVMVIVVLSLDSDGSAAGPILLALLKGVALIGFIYVVGTRVFPAAWRRLALTRSRELSLLAALTLAIGLAAGSMLLGLSVAFGAFLAGLAVSESEFGYQTLAEIVPLRDIFATVFFVAMGMLIDPSVAFQNLELLLVIALALTVGKAFVSSLAVLIIGMPLRTALMAGLILAQVGEFSFVMTRVALDAGAIREDLASAFLGAAGISILVSPALASSGEYLLKLAARIPGLAGYVDPPVQAVGLEDEQALRRHVVICGFGGSGSALARTLAGRGLPFIVIDSNPFLLDDAKREDVPFIYGDASRVDALELAGTERARILAVTIPSSLESRIAVQNALRLNPGVDIVVRGDRNARDEFLSAGAHEVVDAEFEASLEFVRHVLHRYGVDAREIAALQARRRAEHYGHA